MKEALVTPQMVEIRIPDLNITLRQGYPVYLSKEDFDSSQDLRHAHQIGAIRVDWVERCKSLKQVPAEPLKYKAPWGYRKTSPVRAPSQASPEPKMAEIVASDDVGEKVQEAVSSAVSEAVTEVLQQSQVQQQQMLMLIQSLQNQVLDLTQQLQNRPEPKSDSSDLSEIKSLLSNLATNPQSVVSSNPVAHKKGPHSGPHSGPQDAPMYIPTQITKDVEGKVEVKSETTENAQLDEATAALRALRKRKKTKDNS